MNFLAVKSNSVGWLKVLVCLLYSLKPTLCQTLKGHFMTHIRQRFQKGDKKKNNCMVTADTAAPWPSI